MVRVATILSFEFPDPQEDYGEEEHDDASDASGDCLEFSFAQPLSPVGGEHPSEALSDDLITHGRILPAYPVFHRHQTHDDASASPATVPPLPDTSMGEAARRFRVRDILGSSGRSQSDGKEKFLFLQATPAKPKPSEQALLQQARRCGRARRREDDNQHKNILPAVTKSHTTVLKSGVTFSTPWN
ncbi:hypothetical protein D1007_37619 [Hordeum vulgare]|nr:hypothetical protein D1007_37619 [Hordeum vulgare]